MSEKFVKQLYQNEKKTKSNIKGAIMRYIVIEIERCSVCPKNNGGDGWDGHPWAVCELKNQKVISSEDFKDDKDFPPWCPLKKEK